MPSLLSQADDLAGRITNRLIERLPGPQIDVTTSTPIVSFTFDDVPDTALTNGATILERYGARGTFYISGGLANRREADRTMINTAGCIELSRRGHELGCHTFTHPNLRHLSGDALARDIARNRDYLASIDPNHVPRNFAYPYTAGSFRARSLLAREFRSMRGGLYGVNRGRVDRTYLRGIPLEQPETSVLALRNVIDDLVRNPGWAIFFGHDVSDQPTPYGCTPESFDALVRHAREAGCEILTVNAALDRFGVTP